MKDTNNIIPWLHIKQTRVDDTYDNHNILILPSYTEGQPM